MGNKKNQESASDTQNGTDVKLHQKKKKRYFRWHKRSIKKDVGGVSATATATVNGNAAPIVIEGETVIVNESAPTSVDESAPAIDCQPIAVNESGLVAVNGSALVSVSETADAVNESEPDTVNGGALASVSETADAVNESEPATVNGSASTIVSDAAVAAKPATVNGSASTIVSGAADDVNESEPVTVNGSASTTVSEISDAVNKKEPAIVNGSASAVKKIGTTAVIGNAATATKKTTRVSKRRMQSFAGRFQDIEATPYGLTPEMHTMLSRAYADCFESRIRRGASCAEEDSMAMYARMPIVEPHFVSQLWSASDAWKKKALMIFALRYRDQERGLVRLLGKEGKDLFETLTLSSTWMDLFQELPRILSELEVWPLNSLYAAGDMNYAYIVIETALRRLGKSRWYEAYHVLFSCAHPAGVFAGLIQRFAINEVCLSALGDPLSPLSVQSVSDRFIVDQNRVGWLTSVTFSCVLYGDHDANRGGKGAVLHKMTRDMDHATNILRSALRAD